MGRNFCLGYLNNCTGLPKNTTTNIVYHGIYKDSFTIQKDVMIHEYNLIFQKNLMQLKLSMHVIPIIELLHRPLR